MVSITIEYLLVFLQEQAKLRMMKQESSGKADSYWDNLWGEPKDYQNSGIADSKA
jgi:hypothetical protein